MTFTEENLEQAISALLRRQRYPQHKEGPSDLPHASGAWGRGRGGLRISFGLSAHKQP